MRVAWMLENLLYWNGGVKYVFQVCKRLIERCELDVYVTQSSAENKRLFNEAGIEVKEFSNVQSGMRRYWLFHPYYIQASRKRLKPVLAEYDVVISNSPGTNLIAAGLGKKTIFLFFEPNPYIYAPYFIKGLPVLPRYLVRCAYPLIWMYDMWAMKKADRLLSVTKFAATRGEQIYKRPVKVIYPGIDTKLFTRKQDPALEAKYSAYKVILHSATYINPVKGTHFLIKALPKIIAQVPECRVLILNSMRDEKARANLIDMAHKLNVASHIEFLPFIEEEDLPYYYSLAKAVVQPSIYESFRLSLQEGAACETPGISFSGGSADEDIVHGETGFIVPLGDIDSLAERSIELLKDSQLRERMGKVGRKRAKRMFSWDKNVEAMWKFIKS
jgi:glycosyltransferase involved in cell wall biosynthesis